jgi:hypothetical protein
MVDDEGPPMRSFDLDRLRAVARDRRDEFCRALPFPHVVIDDFLDPDVAARLVDEIATTEGEWIFYHHVNERKRGFNDVARMGPTARQVVAELNDAAMLAVLATLTGIPDLRADPILEGGGFSEVERGGYVNVHADFLSHSRERTWTRRLNLIVFLNTGWSEQDGGALELWDRQVQRAEQRVTPTFNRAIIFTTTAEAFHAVEPVRCAEGRKRRSLALYYFTDDHTVRPIRSTHYVPKPTDTRKQRLLIHLDRMALHAYAMLKRYTPFTDKLMSRILKRL